MAKVPKTAFGALLMCVKDKRLFKLMVLVYVAYLQGFNWIMLRKVLNLQIIFGPVCKALAPFETDQSSCG